jgi:tight adherence protein C
MDTFMTLLQSYVPHPETQRLVLMGLAGLTVFLFALGVSSLVTVAIDPKRRRLDALTPSSENDNDKSNSFAAWVHGAASYVLPAKGAERDKVQQQLTHAGLRSPNAMAIFYGIKTCLALGLAAAIMVGSRWMPQISSSGIFFYLMLAAAVGMLTPNMVLRHLVEKRQKRLRNGFPDALDMLVICVEAGLGLTAAIQRVADELQFSHPELASEFGLVNAETRAGVERETALRNLTDRTGLDDVRGLVSLLVQTLRFGTGVADTLRVYSEEFRDKRMQKAEEQAAKIGTKLIFPLVLCLFPSFFVVAIGPAVIRIIDVLSQLGTSVSR